MLAVAAGRCEVALIAYASRQRSRRSRDAARRVTDTARRAVRGLYGLPSPIGHYALAAARHMHQFGTTAEQLAEVAVAARTWAQRNPKAWSRDPLSVADVLDSPLICDPLHRLDVCLVTDGGGAVVITTEARARDAAKRPIRVIGAGEIQMAWLTTQMADLTVTPGVVSGREAFAMAGIEPADVDMLEPYDSFTITVILALEDLGFCAKGEGGAVRRRRPAGPRRRAAGDDLGRRAVLQPSRRLRAAPADRGRAPTARRGRRPAGARRRRSPSPTASGGLLSTAATVVLARD